MNNSKKIISQKIHSSSQVMMKHPKSMSMMMYDKKDKRMETRQQMMNEGEIKKGKK